jgi:ribonuclease R
MLPTELSENLCSLRPNEPRLTITVIIDIDQQGNTTHIKIVNSVIESKKRIIYEDLQAEYNENKKNPSWSFHPHFELYRILKNYRQRRGSIDFELPEAEIIVDKNGEPIEVVHRARMDAHKMIEEFMIRANEAVTEWMLKKQHPFVYRIHGLPSIDALKRFGSIAKTLGIHIHPKLWESEEIEPIRIAEMVKTLEEHPVAEFLNHALLRSMKQAIYSNENEGHFGLASKAYTHFTSPIRRYPDLIVHRLLKMALKNEKYDRKKLEQKLAEQCDHSSYRERLAAEAEREMIKLKQVRIAKTCIGKVYNGKLTGMTANGFFVGIDHPYFEGFVSKDSIQYDFFEFNEERMIYYGRKTKTTLKIGDRLDVLVVRADIEKRQIDFEWQQGKNK